MFALGRGLRVAEVATGAGFTIRRLRDTGDIRIRSERTTYAFIRRRQPLANAKRAFCTLCTVAALNEAR